MSHPLQTAASVLDTVDWPIVRTIFEAAFLGVGGFILRMVWKSYELSKQLHVAVYGDKDADPPNGMKRSLNSMSTRFEAHVTGEERWQQRIEQGIIDRNNEFQEMITKASPGDVLYGHGPGQTERRRHPR